MNTPTLVFSIILAVLSLFLIVVVLLQPSKSQGLSGSISGGAETFFGKGKARGMEAVLSKATAIVATLFILIVLGMHFLG